MSTPRRSHRKGRKPRTARWRTFHSSWARSLLEPADGCWLRFVPNTVRGTPERCGLFLLWRRRSRQLDCWRCVATFASRKPGGPIDRKNGLGQKSKARPFSSLFANLINEDRSCACTICHRRRSRVDCSALSGKLGKAKGIDQNFRV